jgi:Putative lumazine-binding
MPTALPSSRWVQTYLDGLYEGDADKLAGVFHETSALTCEQDGKLSLLKVDGRWVVAQKVFATVVKP